jgi:hypothetical protein
MLLAAISPLLMISCNKSEDIVLDFDITVPDNWTHMILANEGWIYSANRNQVNLQDTMNEFLVIFKENLPGYNLNTYYNYLSPIIKGLNSYDSTIYETDTSINGTDFKKWVLSEYQIYAHDSLNKITERYFFFEGNYGYNFLFVSQDTLYYSKNRELFDNIMSSFKFNGN